MKTLILKCIINYTSIFLDDYILLYNLQLTSIHFNICNVNCTVSVDYCQLVLGGIYIVYVTSWNCEKLEGVFWMYRTWQWAKSGLVMTWYYAVWNTKVNNRNVVLFQLCFASSTGGLDERLKKELTINYNYRSKSENRD